VTVPIDAQPAAVIRKIISNVAGLEIDQSHRIPLQAVVATKQSKLTGCP
jgi:hypothetical protein